MVWDIRALYFEFKFSVHKSFCYNKEKMSECFRRL
jgi:hypothetical protein